MNNRINALACRMGGLTAVAIVGVSAGNVKAAENDSGRKSLVLEEIVVTAQKRGQERLQDIPIPVSVVSASSLLQNGGTGLKDYFTKIPGVSLTSASGGRSAVIIRGVVGNGTNDNPTVGVVVDDAPYGASTFLGGGLQPIDIDPNELAQIEVLRGPQGTLYGASSLGGLLRYVLVDPSLDEVSSRVALSTESASNGDGLAYGARGSINLPIGSSLAVLGSGFDRRDAGYIDDTFSGAQGINDGHSYGGRVALLWRANEDWTVKLSALRQLLRADAANVVDLDPSENESLVTSDYVPNGNGTDRSVTFLTGKIDGRIGSTDIAVISSYTSSDTFAREGLTRGIFLTLAQILQPSADAATWSNQQEVSKFSQEIRANIPIGDNVDWLVGAFYTEETGDYHETIGSALRGTGARINGADLFDTAYSPEYREMAAFTNLTVRFTDRFDVQFGGRLSENRQELSSLQSGFLIPGGGPVANGPVTSKDSPFTYLVAPRFKFTDDFMIYSRIATGYRPGGPAFNSALTGGPKSLDADTTENYELGVKGDLFNRVLSIDASVYYIDWTKIPVGIQPSASSPLGYNVNAGGAISKGVELSLDLRPLPGLTLSAWGAWNDAYIDQLPTNETAAFGEGDRLAFSPRFAGYASVDYERPVFETLSANLGASVNYVGERLYGTGVPANNILNAYTQVDAHIGLKSGSWTVNAFVNNITDERGRIGPKALGSNPPTSVLIIRPRTVGLSVSKDF